MNEVEFRLIQTSPNSFSEDRDVYASEDTRLIPFSNALRRKCSAGGGLEKLPNVSRVMTFLFDSIKEEDVMLLALRAVQIRFESEARKSNSLERRQLLSNDVQDKFYNVARLFEKTPRTLSPEVQELRSVEQGAIARVQQSRGISYTEAAKVVAEAMKAME